MNTTQWCSRAIAFVVLSVIIGFALGFIDFGALIGGGTRSVVAIAVALVLAMLVASGCRTGDDDAKTQAASRNKSTR